jgi:hypothetical protein
MKSGSEPDVRQGIQEMLDDLAPGRFRCVERKSSGESVIGKPADLEIRSTGATPHAVLAIEVANVNTTQLVGEACRLYYDSCPLKILVLGDRNVPQNGVELCRCLLARLYGQQNIEHTPARVVNYDEDEKLEAALKELLLL